jgi:hypothetical protein
MSQSITVSTPATLAELSAQAMAYMAAQTGVASDTTPGSQIRTLTEAFGQIGEQQGVFAQALAFQAIVYGCMAAFNIVPLLATVAQGSVVFSTGPTSPPSATQNVIISQGTIVQTISGTQYQTTETVVLAQGGTVVSATVEALVAGAAGNVTTTGTVTSIVSGIPYPLYVTNTASITGGTDAEAPSATLARFVAKCLSLGLASPVAIASAAIGITAPNSSETVMYSTVFEPWTLQAPGYQTAGFVLYIDNGSGNASAPLIAAVTSVLNGSLALNQSGYRDAGVPYSVLAVTPTNYSVAVTGALSDPTQDSAMSSAVVTALQQYQASLVFGQDPEASQITALVGDVLANIATAFTVTVLDSSSVPQQIIPVAATSRAALTAVSCVLS